MKNKSKKITYITKVRLGDKVEIVECPRFCPKGHTDYSGFGAHQDKGRHADRRERKLEEKRARMGDYE
jgi:hypothetical protein